MILLLLSYVTPSMLYMASAPVSELARTFWPTDDAQIYQKYPDSNYGGLTWVAVQSATSENCRGLLRFDLSNIPPGAKVISARVYLFKYIAPSVSRTYYCHPASSSWSESSLTWNNQPGIYTTGSTTVIGTTPSTWSSWDVASSVQKFAARDAASAASNYGWKIGDNSEGSVTTYQSFFYSKEHSDAAYRPYLRLTYYPPHLELQTYGSSFVAGNWVKMTVNRKDYDNNPITRGNLNVKMTSTSTSLNKKFSLSEGGAAITSLVIPDGSSSKDFWYYDDKAGTWTIQAFTDDYMYYVSGVPPYMIFEMNYGDDKAQQTVNPAALDRFVLNTISSPKTAGEAFMITITAKDVYGNTVTTYTGTNSLSDTTGTMAPPLTGAFVSGVWSGNVIINKVASAVRISTSGGGKTGQSNAFDVKAGPPAKIAIKPATLTAAAAVQYSSITLSIRDSHDFNTSSASAIVIALSTTSPDGEFRNPGTTTRITSITVPPGATYVLVDYFDIRGGTWILTASAAGLSSGTATVTVIPDTRPPETSINAGSPKYQTSTTLYVTDLTAFTLSAIDDASGVKETKYRIDTGPWTLYSGDFNLGTYSEGTHTIGFYSVDRAGNSEPERTLSAFIDKTPPRVQIIEPVGSVVAKTASVRFRASVVETGSGIATIECILDGTSKGPMAKEGEAYAITLDVVPGMHRWSVDAVDNIGNTLGATAETQFILTIDTDPPVISNVALSPPSPVWMEQIKVSASITDAASGLKQATLYYSTDSGATWSKITMTPTAGAFEATIPAQGPMAKVQYYIEASDLLANTTRNSTQEISIGIPIWGYGAGGLIIVLILIFLLTRLTGKPAQVPSPTYPPPPQPQPPPPPPP